jgi:hypothetical protein
VGSGCRMCEGVALRMKFERAGFMVGAVGLGICICICFCFW